MVGLVRITLRLLADILQLAVSMLRPARALATENLVFRRQLAFYRDRGIKPCRVDSASRSHQGDIHG
jgi:putative transposase